ncbi:F-box domain [Trichophyton rubrum]|nr:F-box domain [Trichophyton rubrum]
MSSSGAPYCIICGALIHNRTRRNEWPGQYRAVRAASLNEEPFLTGVARFVHGERLLRAPSNPYERYENDRYINETKSDEFPSQGRTSEDHPLPGFVFHDACWEILKALVHPQEISIPRLYDLCLSFPSQEFGLLTWGHGYESSSSDAEIITHHRSTYQQSFFLRDPFDIPELQEALDEAKKERSNENTAERSIIAERADCDQFYSLPFEIREDIQCMLSLRDVFSLRIASRSFGSMPLSQHFWRSRFLPSFERGFIFEALRPQLDKTTSDATIHYNWKALYEKTNPNLEHFEAIRNRRRIWECNKSLAALLISQPPLEDGSAYSMEEHNHVLWRTAAAKPREPPRTQPSRGRFPGSAPLPPPSIVKEHAIRVPTQVSHVGVSLVCFGGNTYVSGIRISTPDEKEVRLGYIRPDNEVILNISQKGAESNSHPLTGFAICADPGGIRGIRTATADGTLSNWAGDHHDVPSTLRLCLNERVTHIKAKFDAFRLISLSVPEEEQIHSQNPPCLSPRKATLWYPHIPSEHQSLHELDFVYQDEPQPFLLNYQQPHILLMFGGEKGNYLPYLTKISVSTLAGILTWIDFHYECEGAPIICLPVYQGRVKHGNQSKIQFNIDGPGGERVTGFRVKDKQWRTPKNEPISFSIATLEVTTNRGRSFTFDANVLPKIRLPLGHGQQKKKKLDIEPGSTITGIYITHEPTNGLTGLGIVSEKVLM